MLNAGQLDERFPSSAGGRGRLEGAVNELRPAEHAARDLHGRQQHMALAGGFSLAPTPSRAMPRRQDRGARTGQATPRASALPFPARRHPLDLAAKRIFDIAFAAAFLLVAAPFLTLLAIALKLDSPGPLFFVQRRVGHDGKLFGCIKFRTMRVDADVVLAHLLATCPTSRAEWEADHKLRNDPRVSRLGRIARKLSLDELPQLVNILRGEMSVVGPRPIVQAEIPRYGATFADYCAVKPGLTGLWQVSGRNDVTYAERVALDREYRQRASFLFDLRIVWRTVPAVLGAHGSY